MRTTIIAIIFSLGLTSCDDKADDAKGKSITAKKDGKIDGKKADAKANAKADAKATKPDTKVDTKADTKADTAADKPDEPATDTPAGGEEAEKIGQLATLARAIAAKPEDADAILEKAGMDRGAFEAAMVAVAKDQWKTDLYLTALSQSDQTG